MKAKFSYQHIASALLATLLLAGLFYLPYLSVRDETIDTFRSQQILFAQQAGSGLQSFLATYEKALAYLVQQPGIQAMDDGARALLENFISIHPADLSAIVRVDATGAVLFSTPAGALGQEAAGAGLCLQAREGQGPLLGEVLTAAGKEARVLFAAPVTEGGRFAGCLSFALPFASLVDRLLGPIPRQHDGAVLLFSRQGQLLYGPDAGLVGRDLDDLGGAPGDREQLRRQLLAKEQGIALLDRDLLGSPTATHPARRMYAVLFPVELGGGASWSIVILAPVTEVLGAMAEFRSQWFLVTGLAVLAVGLLSFFLSGLVARRREEQRRRAVEEQLAGLLDLAPLAVFLLDQKDAIVYANQEAVRLVAGAEASVPLGSDFLAFFPPASRRSVVAGIRDSAAGQAVSIDGLRLLTHSRLERETVITITPFPLGDQLQRIVIVRDVTEERRAEKMRSHLAAAVDQVKESVLIADRRETIEYVNTALGEMTGYQRQECCGQPVRLLWAGEQEAHFEQRLADVIHRGEVWRGRIVNRRKDGSLFVTAATVSPVRDSLGVISHFVAVQRDITFEVEVESRMRQAQKMEAIGILAGGIAHDFNNILGGIIGFTDMALLQSPAESELHHNLLHIRRGGKRAADLVQQILTFSRQSAEEKMPVAVAALVKESLQLMRATLPATIAITLELAAEEAMVLAAPVQIQQIVINLCANALYSMREKGGHLFIRLDRLTAEQCQQGEQGGGDWLSLVVEDTGQGIDSGILSHIFTPFFTTKKPGEGTGMGLSVVHGIVRELGGEITVQSQPGVVTTFTVLLPVVDGVDQGALLSSEAPLPVGSEHILVVDDEKEIRETYQMMLNHLGYTVTPVATPGEVLGRISTAEPRIDLVITDQTMPIQTGVALTGEIRRLYPDLPVILCTGYSDRLNADIAREAGACDLLMKPVDLRGLGTAVRAALDLNR